MREKRPPSTLDEGSFHIRVREPCRDSRGKLDPKALTRDFRCMSFTNLSKRRHLDVIATPVTATDGNNRGVHGTNRGGMLREGAAPRFHGVATGSREGLKKLPRADDPNPPERVQREKMRFVSRYQEVRFAPERALQDQVVSGILDDGVDHDRRLHAFRHVADELRNLLSGSFAQPEFPLEDVLELSEDRR